MSLTTALLAAFGLMTLGAVITGPSVYAHGRRKGRADLRLDAAEAQRILAGWATERAREWPAVEPHRPGGYRGRRRAAASSWRGRWAGWWQATAPAGTHAAVAAAMAGATTPLRDRYAGTAVVRVAAPVRLRLDPDWQAAPRPIPVVELFGQPIPAGVA